MRVGGVYHHDDFYVSTETGQLLPKYLVILALPTGADVVFRVLTSRHAEVRPPGCHHGAPYPGFALGIPGNGLTQPTWVDLRQEDDYDVDVFRGRLAKGQIQSVFQLAPMPLRDLLLCAAAADDTTRQQSSHIQDALATVR